MNKDYQYWLGYVLTIISGILLTPLYAIAIIAIRTIVFLVELVSDIFTFMPKALYQYERIKLKQYWEKELERIKKL